MYRSTSKKNSCIALVKRGIVNRPGKTVYVGDKVAFSFEVHNTGNVSLSNVSIVDTKLRQESIRNFSGDVNADNILDPGELWITSVDYDLKEEDLVMEQVVNQAYVIGSSPKGIEVKDFLGSELTTDNQTIVPLKVLKAAVVNPTLRQYTRKSSF